MPQRAAIDWSFPITVTGMVDLGQPKGEKRNSETLTADLLERVGMGELGSRRLNQLSGGQQQRVLLARALRQQTGVLLLDEPCSAIDPPTREHLLRVMRQQADKGQTLLVSSHDCRRLTTTTEWWFRCRVLACGTPDDVRSKLTDLTCMMGSHCCG